MERTAQLVACWLICLCVWTASGQEETQRQEVRPQVDQIPSFNWGIKEDMDRYIEFMKTTVDPSHPNFSMIPYYVGYPFYKKGEYNVALDYFEQHVELSKEHLGAVHPDTLAALSNLGHTLHLSGRLNEAYEMQRQAFDTSTKHLGAKHQTTLGISLQLAAILRDLGELEKARELQENAVQTRKQTLGLGHPETLGARRSFACTLRFQGKIQAAKQGYQDTLETSRDVLGEEHEDTLQTIKEFADVLMAAKDYQAAREKFQEIFEISVRLHGNEHSQTLKFRAQLATALQKLGDLRNAREHLEQVYDARRRSLGQDNPETLEAQQRFASVLASLGDYQGARREYMEILKMGGRVLGPTHPSMLRTSSNLASTLRSSGDLERAKRQFENVLEGRKLVLGDSHPQTIIATLNIARTLHQLGDLEAARQQYMQTLAISKRQLGEQHSITLNTRANLAVLLDSLGDFAAAKEQYKQTLSIWEPLFGHEDPRVLIAKANLIQILRKLGKTEQQYADDLTNQLLNNGAQFTPKTPNEASQLFYLGTQYQDLKAPKKASRLFQTGLEALETQMLDSDPTEDIKIRFIERYASAYRQAINISINNGDITSAFHILERYRAQRLRAQIRWNIPRSEQEIPQRTLDELTNIAERYDWLTREQNRQYPLLVPELLEEQANLRRRRNIIHGKIIESHRIKGQLPDPFEVDTVQQILDPESILLAFNISGASKNSFLFLLTKSEIQVHPIDFDDTEIWTQIRRLRTLELATHSESNEAKFEIGNWLYDKLFAPVARQIEDAERIVILPDGPLNYLHFSALTRPAPDDPRGWQYLAEWKPIHTVQSATVYAELIARRSKEPSQSKDNPIQWVGFGKPFYPKAEDVLLAENARSVNDPGLPEALRSTQERGIWGGLTPLPYTEREIEGIAKLFPEDAAQHFLLKDANEDRARQILGKAPIVHFAAHGVADPDFPMDSFLALSLLEGQDGAQHNGLLQAWEIANDLQLDADLVVLSACVTALGPNRGGEGLISLSRAFQIAGARSVLASLWAVNDLSTSELMIRFYKHLRNGETKDRALQLAQQELIAGPIEVTLDDGTVVTKDFSAPYHWAAFQLIGDWR